MKAGSIFMLVLVNSFKITCSNYISLWFANGIYHLNTHWYDAAIMFKMSYTICFSSTLDILSNLLGLLGYQGLLKSSLKPLLKRSLSSSQPEVK